jgi:membrane protein DedA with SNARE-associated domain
MAQVALLSAVHGLATSGANPGGVSGWLLHFHGTTAYVLVGALTFAEAALMVGFFIPGETAVVIGGVLAGLHQVDLEIMMAVVVVCAITGDSVGFEVGKRSGSWLLERRPLKGNAGVARSLSLLEHYGGPAVFLGRFVYNAAGGLIWGVGYTLLGFIVGVSFERILSSIGVWSLAVVGGVVVVAVIVRLVLKRRHSSSGGPGTGSGATVVEVADVTGSADDDEEPRRL